MKQILLMICLILSMKSQYNRRKYCSCTSESSSTNYCQTWSCIERKVGESQNECFRLDSTVITSISNNQLIHTPISSLKIGDTILTLNPNSLELESDKFLGYLDYSNSVTTFISFKSISSSILDITSTHVLFAVRDNEIGHYFAMELNEGDWLLQNGIWVQIHKIMSYQGQGAAAPLTQSGYVYVDNVLASNYAYTKDQQYADFAFKPYKLIPDLAKSQILLDLYVQILKFIYTLKL